MGECADDILNGIVCELCGEFFAAKIVGKNVLGHKHGYPAVCKTCWGDLEKGERRHHRPATVSTIGELQEK